jgi:hypothetical protein
MKIHLRILLYIILFSSSLSAQIIKDSLSFLQSNYHKNYIHSDLNKQLNTLNYIGALQYHIKSERIFAGVETRFLSTINKGTTKNIKDESHLSFLGEYDLSEKMSLGTFVTNNIYSDDRKLDINKSNNVNASIFSKLKPIENIRLIPYYGYSMNKQVDEFDSGNIYGIEGIVDDLRMSDLLFYSSAKFENEDILPRRNLQRMINLNLLSEIETSINNIVSTGYAQQRRDFYIQSDSITSAQFNVKNNIQSRIETNYFISDRLIFNSPSSNVAFDITGSAAWRNIDRNTRYISLSNITSSSYDALVEEFKIDLSSAVEYQADWFRTLLRLSVAEREEVHKPKYIEGTNRIFFEERERLENQKNNQSLLTTISLSSRFELTEKSDITVSMFHRKLKYDTQSEENFDDRDELLSLFRIIYSNQLTPVFKWFVNTEASLQHIVYLFSERSSNNNRQRFIKLSSGGYYRTKKIRSFNSAEVSANYTTYDFEDINPTSRSFSFRQFYFVDSTQINLSKNIAFDFSGYIKLSEQGEFKWDNFTGKPVRFLEEIYLEPKFVYFYSDWKFGVGLRRFTLTTFNYQNGKDRIKDTEYNSTGPLAEITYFSDYKFNILLYGWYEFISTQDNTKRETANLNLNIKWNL